MLVVIFYFVAQVHKYMYAIVPNGQMYVYVWQGMFRSMGLFFAFSGEALGA
jgi:hypothetical protein